MTAKYGALKIVAIFGTLLSIYRCFVDTLLLEDILLMALAALTVVAIANERTKAKSRGKQAAEQGEKLSAIEETIERKIAEALAAS